MSKTYPAVRCKQCGELTAVSDYHLVVSSCIVQSGKVLMRTHIAINEEETFCNSDCLCEFIKEQTTDA